MKKVLIFFDIDGTLVTLAEPVQEVYARIANSHGISIDASALKPFISSRWEDMHMEYVNAAGGFKTDERRERNFWESFVATCFGDEHAKHENFPTVFDEIYLHYEKPESRTLLPGVEKALSDLKALGFELGAHSNLDSRILRYLKTTEIQDYFDYQFCVSEVGFKKPSLQVFKELERLSEGEGKIKFHIGNTVDLDYQPAKAAGWKSLLLAEGDSQPGVESVTWQNLVETTKKCL